jgi:HAD superfamily hydrolase (TIGR01662 family)
MRRAYLWSKLSRRDFSYADVLARVAVILNLVIAPEELATLAWLWYQPIGDASHVDSGIRHMLTQLRNAGTRLAIVSNTFVPPHCLDRHLREEGLLEFFPVRIYSSSVRYRKPHPRIFEMALSEVGVPATRALFIGDLLATDIAGAKRAGMRTIWKPARHSANRLARPAFLRRRRHAPDFVIPKVTQLIEALHHFGWHPKHGHPAIPVLASS